MKIHSFTEPESKFLEYAPWFITLNQQHYALTDCKPQGTFLIGKIAGYDSPEAVKHFVNSPIVISKTQLPTLSSDEYYWADLLNLDVYNLQNEYLGNIESFFNTGANDVMVIVQNQKKIMIPFVKDHFVKHIDLTHKKMIVDWQEDWL